jgi:hypothetical protein
MNEPTSLDADLAALRAQKATWQTDGKGIRGDVKRIHDSQANLVWENKPPQNRAPVDLPA